jgi:hypothetical protein
MANNKYQNNFLVILVAVILGIVSAKIIAKILV